MRMERRDVRRCYAKDLGDRTFLESVMLTSKIKVSVRISVFLSILVVREKALSRMAKLADGWTDVAVANHCGRVDLLQWLRLKGIRKVIQKVINYSTKSHAN